MTTVNMLKAKSSLSRLVEALESGQETEIIIAAMASRRRNLSLTRSRAVE